MSQKIDGGIAPSTQVRQVATPTRTAAAGNGAGRPVEAADSLRLTGEATSLQALQRQLSTAPAVDNARVQAVREALGVEGLQSRVELLRGPDRKSHPSTPDCERSARKNTPQAESGRRGQIAAFSFLGSSKQYVALAGINIECFGRLIDCDWLFGD